MAAKELERKRKRDENGTDSGVTGKRRCGGDSGAAGHYVGDDPDDFGAGHGGRKVPAYELWRAMGVEGCLVIHNW
eukprot:CAMPEP_0119157664 /NCGR_PEP_ID=MMETSP1310-20130426/52870_1 /TAXON_ID=464262 /ORGANISM="Genus nov. species nov., Strain RCC2339" /LENGTH=74 /DNA_ID=CAMNT_0007150283 /DNA_START=943 /DNA_END=1164 /DNA_ORIENTATION=+